MAIAEWIAAVQTTGAQTESNSAIAKYLIFALVAAVVGLVLMMFIRTSSSRSSK
jgi:heme/copper-type cytochrome/quinol oxidase subunit 1